MLHKARVGILRINLHVHEEQRAHVELPVSWAAGCGVHEHQVRMYPYPSLLGASLKNKLVESRTNINYGMLGRG